MPMANLAALQTSSAGGDSADSGWTWPNISNVGGTVQASVDSAIGGADISIQLTGAIVLILLTVIVLAVAKWPVL